ncbi:MAG: thiamine-monophosphate kinase [Candidatus Binatia bacterium]
MKTTFDPDAMPTWLASVFNVGRPRSVLAGINDDDCAVLRWRDRFLVITTDFLNSRPIAVELGLGSWSTLGRLVVAANLSDLCGTGAMPEALLLGIMMPRSAKRQEFHLLMRGVKYEARRWGIPVVGGDTKLGEAPAILAVAVGSVRSRRSLFLKNQAKPGDLLWTSGPLGSCCAAVYGLKNDALSSRWRRWAVQRITVPDLPLSKSRMLADVGLGRSGIDISDGLGADLARLCVASHVGAVVDTERIPVAPEVSELAEIHNLPPWSFAFGTGGDFQFLVTTRPGARDRVKAMGFHLIGRIVPGRRLYLNNAGRLHQFPKGGHRDVRNLSFADEIKQLVERASSGQHR